MKKIWLINYYSSPPDYVANPRHLEFADNLMKNGYDVTIISSSFIRTKSIDLIPSSKKILEVYYGKYKFIHIKVKHYTGNGLSRMISIWQFATRINKYLKRKEKPDIILHNIHAPFDYPISQFAKKINCIYIVEAWDLWPDSFVRFGLINAKNPLVKIAYTLERKLYEKADKVIFTFEGGVDYLREKKWTIDTGGKIDISKISYINNGVNITKFNENVHLYPSEDQDLNNTSFKKVIYLGSIRLVNNIKLLIDAAGSMQHENVKFLIYGDGTDRSLLENYCKEKQISNVIFKNKWMPFNEVPYILSKGNLNILNYQKGFGIYGLSSGKLFMYLASGIPICCNLNMSYCLINKFNLGVSKEFQNSSEYADAIKHILDLDKDDYESMCNRVKEVSKIFDYKTLSQQLINTLEN